MLMKNRPATPRPYHILDHPGGDMEATVPLVWYMMVHGRFVSRFTSFHLVQTVVLSGVMRKASLAVSRAFGRWPSTLRRAFGREEATHRV